MSEDNTSRWLRQKALFLNVLECDAAARQALLADVAAREPELARDVADLLKVHELDDGFLAYPFVSRPDAGGRGGTFIGEVFDGKYRIETLLRRGGMGSVYRAVHLWTERAVAVKIIAPELMAMPEFVERFKREAKAAGRIRHPNVVNVTDFGFVNVGGIDVGYLVMEHLDGCTLAEHLATIPLPPVEFVVDVIEQVSLALGKAHSQGVLHRDLKPANVWLEPDGRGGTTVKVLDFGIAKLGEPPSVAETADTPRHVSALPSATMPTGEHVVCIKPAGTTRADAQAADRESDLPPVGASPFEARNSTPGELDPRTIESRLTRSGAVLGTPEYMSPEQCQSAVLTPASDIYSLGVLAYQMFAGALPFSGSTNELIIKHSEMPPPPLRVRRHAVTRDLADTVLSALAKEPADRPPNARAFALAMRTIAQGQPALFEHARQWLDTCDAAARRLMFVVMLPGVFAVSLLIAAMMRHWLVEPPYSWLVQIAAWILPLIALTTALDSVAAVAALMLAGSRQESSASKTESLLDLILSVTGGLMVASFAATLIPGALLAPIVVVTEGSSLRASISRSRQLLGPFGSLGRGLYIGRLVGAALSLVTGALAGGLATHYIGVDAHLAPQIVAMVFLVAVTVATLISQRAGTARALLYAVARSLDRSSATPGEPPQLAGRVPWPQRRSRLHAAVPVAMLVLLVFGLGSVHLLFVPPLGPIPRAPHDSFARVPESENAWIEYHRAHESSGLSSGSRSESDGIVSSLTHSSQFDEAFVDGSQTAYAFGLAPALDEGQRVLVTSNLEALSQVVAGARRPRAQFTDRETDWRSPIPSAFSGLSLAMLASTRARMLADEGQVAEAVELYLAAYEMSTDYSERSTGLVGTTIAIEGRKAVCRSMFAWLVRGGADPETEIAVVRRLAEMDSRILTPSMVLVDGEVDAAERSLEGALVKGWPGYLQERVGDRALFLQWLVTTTPGLSARVYRDAFEILEARRALGPAMDRWDLAAVDEAARQEAAAQSSWYLSASPSLALIRLVPSASDESAPRLLRAMHSDRAQNAAMRAVLIVDVYRKRFGRLPDSLESACLPLGLDVPRNVATGSTVGYAIESGEPVVSVPCLSGDDFVLRAGIVPTDDERMMPGLSHSLHAITSYQLHGLSPVE